MRVLLTGAAGFIGSRVAAALSASGHDVVAVDAMLAAAHGPGAALPAGCTLLDVRDADGLARVLRGVDVVCHQAAVVGAGVDASDAPAYGAHKAGLDKFAADMAVDLRPFNIAALSIWMGALLTDRLRMVIASDPIKYKDLEAATETPEFTGHAIWALYSDPALMDMSGQAVIGAEMALKYGFADQGGRQPRSCRDTHQVAPRQQYPLILR